MRRSSTVLTLALLAMIAVSRLFAAAEEAAVFLNDSPVRDSILKRLDEPIDLNFEKVTLTSVVSKLRELTKLNILLDDKSLEEAGIDRDTQVTFHVQGISLRSALNLMLRDFEMDWVIRHDVLLLTTFSQGESFLETAIYPVGDLLYPPDLSESRRARRPPDFDSLIESILSTVAPTSWSGESGPGAIRSDLLTNSIVLSQSRDVHDEITELFAELRDVRDRQYFPDRPRASERLPAASIGRERIEAALSARVSIELDPTPLEKAMQRIAADRKLPILIDAKAFEESGIATDLAVKLHVKDIPLRQALRLMLEPLELTYVIRDEVLLITTISQAETIPTTLVYPVRDLVRAIDNHRFDYDSLIGLITSELAPTTWAEDGGIGSIKPFPNAGAVVISQTMEVHEEVVSFLAALRKVHHKQQAATIAPPDGKQRSADELLLVIHQLPIRALMSHAGGGFFQIPAESRQVGAIPIPAVFGEAGDPASRGAIERVRADAARELEKIIPQFIAPESWQGAGGKGTIRAFGDKLIVRQTQSIHDQIDDLVDEL